MTTPQKSYTTEEQQYVEQLLEWMLAAPQQGEQLQLQQELERLAAVPPGSLSVILAYILAYGISSSNGVSSSDHEAMVNAQKRQGAGILLRQLIRRRYKYIKDNSSINSSGVPFVDVLSLDVPLLTAMCLTEKDLGTSPAMARLTQKAASSCLSALLSLTAAEPLPLSVLSVSWPLHLAVRLEQLACAEGAGPQHLAGVARCLSLCLEEKAQNTILEKDAVGVPFLCRAYAILRGILEMTTCSNNIEAEEALLQTQLVILRTVSQISFTVSQKNPWTTDSDDDDDANNGFTVSGNIGSDGGNLTKLRVQGKSPQRERQQNQQQKNEIEAATQEMDEAQRALVQTTLQQLHPFVARLEARYQANTTNNVDNDHNNNAFHKSEHPLAPLLRGYCTALEALTAVMGYWDEDTDVGHAVEQTCLGVLPVVLRWIHQYAGLDAATSARCKGLPAELVRVCLAFISELANNIDSDSDGDSNSGSNLVSALLCAAATVDPYRLSEVCLGTDAAIADNPDDVLIRAGHRGEKGAVGDADDDSNCSMSDGEGAGNAFGDSSGDAEEITMIGTMDDICPLRSEVSHCLDTLACILIDSKGPREEEGCSILERFLVQYLQPVLVPYLNGGATVVQDLSSWLPLETTLSLVASAIDTTFDEADDDNNNTVGQPREQFLSRVLGVALLLLGYDNSETLATTVPPACPPETIL